MTGSPPARRRLWLWSGLGAVALVLALVAEVVWTAPMRGAVGTYNALRAAAERQDIAAVQGLCSRRYLAAHRLRFAPEGGLVGLPRNIHTNFQVWRHGRDVWLCPTNRVGPVYQFVAEDGAWRFDGPVGLLMPGGRVAPLTEAPDDEAEAGRRD